MKAVPSGATSHMRRNTFFLDFDDSGHMDHYDHTRVLLRKSPLRRDNIHVCQHGFPLPREGAAVGFYGSTIRGFRN